MRLDLGLVQKHLLSYLLPVVSSIRPLHSDFNYLSEHALVSDDAQRKEIHPKRVILSIDDLRSHVAGRPRGILVIIRSVEPRHTEVGQSEVSLTIKDQILRL